MDKIFIVGTYDCLPESLLQVDLMQYFDRLNLKISGIIYKTSSGGGPAGVANPQKTRWKNCVTIWTDDFNAPSTVEEISKCEPDLLVYAGGRDILREPFLNAARLGCIGGHYGQLPEIRGMATVEWSTLFGIEPTVTIQRINAGIDTGDVVMQSKVPLLKDDTFIDIRNRSYSMTKLMLALSTDQLLRGELTARKNELDQGQQYFRMHHEIMKLAQKKLSKRLSQAYG